MHLFWWARAPGCDQGMNCWGWVSALIATMLAFLWMLGGWIKKAGLAMIISTLVCPFSTLGTLSKLILFVYCRTGWKDSYLSFKITYRMQCGPKRTQMATWSLLMKTTSIWSSTKTRRFITPTKFSQRKLATKLIIAWFTSTRDFNESPSNMRNRPFDPIGLFGNRYQ